MRSGDLVDRRDDVRQRAVPERDHLPEACAQGEGHFCKALALAEPRGMRPLIAQLGLGKLYQRTDRLEQAREHLAIATTMYREMDMRFWLEQAETRQLA